MMQAPSLGDSLHRLMHAYKAGIRQALFDKQVALPITHVRVLKGVCRNPECTAQSIARRMQRDKAQITRVLNELCRDGLVEKLESRSDRRARRLRPTPQGMEAMRQLRSLEQKTVARMTKNLSRDEIKEFIRLATTMAENLTLDSAPPNR